LIKINFSVRQEDQKGTPYLIKIKSPQAGTLNLEAYSLL